MGSLAFTRDTGTHARMLVGFSNGTAALLQHHLEADEESCQRSDGGETCSAELGGGDTIMFAGHSGWVVATAASPDSLRMLTGGHDGVSFLWDAASGKRLHTF